MTGPQVAQGATQFAVGWIAHNKLLGGLGKLYGGVRTKAQTFFKKNPAATLHDYVQTTEGQLFGVVNNPNVDKHCEEFLHLTDHPAKCRMQKIALQKALKIEEITSLAKCTKHGLERLMERFSLQEIEDLIKWPTDVKFQSDGAKVLIKKIGDNKYNYLVINEIEQEVVSGIAGINSKDIEKLAKNYGWKS